MRGCVVNTAPDAVPTAGVVTANVDATPTAIVTVVVAVKVTPATVALTVAVPDVVPGDRVATYVPLLLSVTPPKDPSVEDMVTVAPPVVMVLPWASFSCTVIVEPAPPTLIEALDAVMVDVDAAAVPGVTLNAVEVAGAKSVAVNSRNLDTPDAPEYTKSLHWTWPEVAATATVPVSAPVPGAPCSDAVITCVELVTVFA